ncbi:hypothetical protein Salat_1412700 [Sesamum alatum]|uniref:Uncharacterized protein n=1 Tax=Sesamum alatum TaxID=300844 RepID=A0AAE2CLD6_9LAMI|nr:hypothetical protein Salat_1412700 [Sesamum alatum]
MATSNTCGGRLDDLQARAVMPKICPGEVYLSFPKTGEDGEVEGAIRFLRPPRLVRPRLRISLPNCFDLKLVEAKRLGLLKVEASRLGLVSRSRLRPRLIHL